MEYANVIWDNCSINEAELLANVQYEAARVVSGAMRGTGRARVSRELASLGKIRNKTFHS